MSIHPGPPHFPATGPERTRFFHSMEWFPNSEWVYKATRALAADHPDGWEPVAPKGWSLNTDRWPRVDEQGWTRVGPGVLLNPYAPGGPVLIAHWRKRR